MSLPPDLENEPRWYRWLIYTLAAGFVGFMLFAGFMDTFFGTVAR